MSETKRTPLVGILMGSRSDLPVMAAAAEALESFEIPFELTIVSAHRSPVRAAEYAQAAAHRGLRVIIAGAGGAAHLPGVLASFTTLPVIGVPIRSENSLDGMDSVLSILQMPSGIPVATMALNGARNAGILAAQILATADAKLARELATFKDSLEDKVRKTAAEVDKLGWRKALQAKG